MCGNVGSDSEAGLYGTMPFRASRHPLWHAAVAGSLAAASLPGNLAQPAPAALTLFHRVHPLIAAPRIVTMGIPETVLKKRKRDEAWLAAKAAAAAAGTKKNKETRKEIFKRAEKYVKEYREQVRGDGSARVAGAGGAVARGGCSVRWARDRRDEAMHAVAREAAAAAC